MTQFPRPEMQEIGKPFKPDVPRQVVELDGYELANLREGLLFLREVGGDTGDWLGQLLFKLAESTTKPNKTVQEQKRDLAVCVGWGLLWPTRQ